MLARDTRGFAGFIQTSVTNNPLFEAQWAKPGHVAVFDQLK